jgi:hypothetical protein
MIKNTNYLIVALFIVLNGYLAGFAQQGDSPMRLDSADYRLFYIAEGTSTVEQQVTIDNVTRIRIQLLSTSNTIVPSLVGPGGQVINQSTVSNYGGTFDSYEIPEANSGLDYDVVMDDQVEGFHFIFDFPSLGAGQYTLRLDAPVSVVDGIAVGAAIKTDSPIGVRLLTGETDIPLGRPMVFTAAVFNNQTAVSGASVNVKITAPNNTISEITLLDNGGTVDNTAGDGLYSGQFTPSMIGDYAALAEISGTIAGNVSFTRQTSAIFRFKIRTTAGFWTAS